MTEKSVMRDGGFRIKRVQANVVARTERRLLTWICVRLPNWITPDLLTVLGVVGAAIVFVSDVASRYHPAFLWLSSFGITIHWFGDSLDGSVARFRQIERPIYGYFLDHTVDAITNLMLMSGMGLTLAVRMDAALFALLGYYLLCMYVFINNHVTGVLQLSFLGFGPTELRICLVAINIAMFFFGYVGFVVAGTPFSIYDAILIFAGSAFTIVFVIRMLAGISALRDAPQEDARAPQSASTKASSPAK